MNFEQALRLAGLRPRDIVPDGRWRRCATEDKPRKRNGAYALSLDGRRGWWRNWALDSDISKWTDDSATPARPIDMAALERRRAAEREQRIAATRRAQAMWADARPLTRLHPYLERKGLSALGCAALREHDGLLVVPVWHGQHLMSLQTIHPDGTKRFAYGAPVKGGALVLDRPRAALTCLVEGLATGLAVFQALRQARVIVCFDAGNLMPVMQRIRPTGSVVVCADNDWGTQARRGVNPGLEKARNAAELIGAGVAYPEAIEGTDWADAMHEWGEGAARRIERLILAQARYVVSAMT